MPFFGATPSAVQQTTTENYISSVDFLSEIHKPDIGETLVRRYGDQSLTGFVDMMGGKRPVANKEYIHYEEDWVHQTFAVKTTVLDTDNVMWEDKTQYHCSNTHPVKKLNNTHSTTIAGAVALKQAKMKVNTRTPAEITKVLQTTDPKLIQRVIELTEKQAARHIAKAPNQETQKDKITHTLLTTQFEQLLKEYRSLIKRKGDNMTTNTKELDISEVLSEMENLAINVAKYEDGVKYLCADKEDGSYEFSFDSYILHYEQYGDSKVFRFDEIETLFELNVNK